MPGCTRTAPRATAEDKTNKSWAGVGETMLAAFVRSPSRASESLLHTHFYPAARATRRPGFEDRFLGPDSGPDSGPRALYLTVGSGHAVPDLRAAFRAQNGTQNQAIPCGVRQRLSYTISRSKSSSSIPTPISLHTRGDGALTADYTKQS